MAKIRAEPCWTREMIGLGKGGVCLGGGGGMLTGNVSVVRLKSWSGSG